MACHKAPAVSRTTARPSLSGTASPNMVRRASAPPASTTRSGNPCNFISSRWVARRVTHSPVSGSSTRSSGSGPPVTVSAGRSRS